MKSVDKAHTALSAVILCGAVYLKPDWRFWALVLACIGLVVAWVSFLTYLEADPRK